MNTFMAAIGLGQNGGPYTMKGILILAAAVGMMLVSGCRPYSSALDAASHIALEGANRLPGNSGSGRPAAHQQSAIDAYTIERCVQMVSINPPRFLSGTNRFEGTPALYNRCSNAAFVLRICYDGTDLALLDQENYERMWNSEAARLACRNQKVKIVPRTITHIRMSQERRQSLRDDWNRAFKK